jgi:hypothetical protein
MIRVFKTRPFGRWMRKSELTDEALRQAVAEMAQRLIDADLGGGVLKKRIALPGRGKRGSARTLIATNRQDRWIFVSGFEKKNLENIDMATLRDLRKLSADLLGLSPRELQRHIETEALTEIPNEP